MQTISVVPCSSEFQMITMLTSGGAETEAVLTSAKKERQDLTVTESNFGNSTLAICAAGLHSVV